MISLSIKKVQLFPFYFILVFPYFLNAQQSIRGEYEKIKESDLDPLVKISKIESLFNNKAHLVDLLELGELHNDFSKICNTTKEYTKAITYAQKALKNLPLEKTNNTYSNLSVFYRKAGNEEKSFLTLKKLVSLPYKDKYTIMAYINGFTKFSIEKGDYYQALEYVQEAERIIRTQKDSTLDKEYYRIPIKYSEIYVKLGSDKNYKKALNYLKEANNLYQKITVEKTRIKNQIIIDNRFGQAYTLLKNYPKAIFHFEKALKTCLDNKKPKYQIAIIYSNLGINYFKNEQFQKAFEYYQKAIHLAPHYTATYDNLGDYYLYQKDYQTSLTYYQKAIDYNTGKSKNHDYKKLPDKGSLEKSRYKTDLLNDLKDKANAWMSYYKENKDPSHLEQALSTVELADYMVDLIRSESIESQSKFFWRSKEIDLYLLATSIAYTLQQPEKAFYFMEKSKSLSLLENLTNEEAKRISHLPDSVIQKEYYLKKSIFLTRQRLDKDSISELDKRHLVYQQKKKYQDFINSLEKDFPNYYRYKKEVSITDLKQCVSEVSRTNSPILQYIFSGKEGYGLFIAPKKTIFFKIESPEVLQEEVLKIGKLINKPWKTPEQKDEFKGLSVSIYNKLFPTQVLPLIDTSQNLTIIPDGILQYFPFEVLQNPKITSFEDSYLINQFNITYCYSNSLHQQIVNKKTTPSKQMMAIAPVNFEHLQLASLSLSVPKLKRFSTEMNADTFLFDQATKDSFVKNSFNYQILHLSSHATSMDSITPWIAFSDNKLTLNELYFTPNQANMVVLDACKTGIGELIPGEGVQSLTRGFFHSGAKSVVSSLWNTNEKSNNEIVQNFYKYLKAGKDKSIALRQSKLDFIKNHQGSEKSPYYWASLIITGDNAPLFYSNNRMYLYIGFIILFLLLIGGLFYKKIKA